MAKDNAIENAQKFCSIVKQSFDCKEVYLFGSFAKGTQTKDSDIDIAVVLNRAKNLLDKQLELMRLRRSIDIRIEPYPFLKEDFIPTNPIAFQILKHGKKLV